MNYDKEEYFRFLDELRESGATNMFGARPYLMDAFSELTDKDAAKVLAEWMKTFEQRHATDDQVGERELN